MIAIGKYHTLHVVKEVSFGLYLSDDERVEEILLPIKYVPEGTKVDDKIQVFIYNDSENRPIATTLKPFAQVGEFAFLKVLDATDFGAFMDLGIAKDVFVPLKEQRVRMRKDGEYVVYIYIDEETGRIAASSKWNKFIDNEMTLQEGEEVALLISDRTDLGFKAIINNKFHGLIYENEVFGNLEIGDRKRGFVKKIREENKIDLTLQQQSYEHIGDVKLDILQQLKLNNGTLPLGDKSTPEEIYEKLNISKKAFKKTIGGLYKDGTIELSDFSIRLLSED